MVRAPAASLTACTSQPCAEVAGRDISMVTRPPNADPPPPVLTLPGGQVATALPAWPPGTVDDALTICWSRTVPHTTSTSKSKLLAVGLKPWTCQPWPDAAGRETPMTTVPAGQLATASAF